MSERYDLGPQRSQGLVDVLDRILDKGLVIAGDIKIHLADVELLTIKVRLLVCSLEKAEQVGLAWWRSDPYFAGPAPATGELAAVAEKLDEIQRRLETLEQKRLE